MLRVIFTFILKVKFILRSWFPFFCSFTFILQVYKLKKKKGASCLKCKNVKRESPPLEGPGGTVRGYGGATGTHQSHHFSTPAKLPGSQYTEAAERETMVMPVAVGELCIRMKSLLQARLEPGLCV